MSEETYIIRNRDNGDDIIPVGSYSRAYRDEYYFRSADSARDANCHGMYTDASKYKISKVRITYEIIEEDIFPVTNDHHK